jgi:hypothetical protein
MKKVSEITSKTKTTYHLTNEDIIGMLKETGRIGKDSTITQVAFRVPGGGDYSNMTLDIEESDPIIVVVEE